VFVLCLCACACTCACCVCVCVRVRVRVRVRVCVHVHVHMGVHVLAREIHISTSSQWARPSFVHGPPIGNHSNRVLASDVCSIYDRSGHINANTIHAGAGAHTQSHTNTHLQTPPHIDTHTQKRTDALTCTRQPHTKHARQQPHRWV